ncbi:hypothetical protein [Neobacillus cucumis]|uniref:hypothetical protein n=1 Tax=Neobacillus cucumis TaxID=1740721 RepID=UPI00285320CA|nr:hypothetical protein [Neobacillus cucumis]MDR4949496.1 hypothetical protein [Neobacillus cucumis]
MQDLLQTYARTFSIQLDKLSLAENEQRSVHYPIVFIFLGDLVKDALKAIKKMNEAKWQNSSGVLYFHAYQTDTVTAGNVLSLQLPGNGFERKSKRKELYEAFYQDETMLVVLNKLFRKLTSKLAEYGRAYSSLQKVNLCVITAVEDPANILIQEFTLLLKSILQESFRIVEVDLYGLLTEKQTDENFAFTTSLGISFLKELDHYQHNEYSFEKELQLTEDFLRLPVSHLSAPLFDMVYLLSDKNEQGLIADGAVQQNYEMISQLNLLKNRRIMTEYHEKMASYQHQDFKRAIKGNAQEPVYASAGFAKVNRPNQAIALHTACHFFHEWQESLKAQTNLPHEKILSLFGLSDSSLQRYLQHYLPPEERLNDMLGLMCATHSYQEVKNMSLAEAEEYLYEGGTQLFFSHNFEEPVREFLKELDLREQIESSFYEKIIYHERYGIFCGYRWTDDTDKEESNVMNEIHRLLQETKDGLIKQQTHLKGTCQQIVDHCDFKKSFLPFSDKKNLNQFIRFFFNEVYGTKYEILKLEIKQAILRQYQTVLAEIHHRLHAKIKLFDQVELYLKKAAAESMYVSNDYLDQNISPYYADRVKAVTARLKEKQGPYFFSDERYFGSLHSYLDDDRPEKLLERLLYVCQREILTQAEFNHNFEEELLARANVLTRYDNREILSKEDLFKKLYLRLEESSSVHIEVFHYTHSNRYEEKYYFGDFYSQFMRFAIEKEHEMRLWKVGCVHEKKLSGIEKLTLMGGFKLTDLMYYRNGEKYYKAYCENGFEFHVIAEESDVDSNVLTE